MLPKSRRLNLKTDFKWVASGKKLETKYLKLFVRMGENNPPAGGSRVGITVSGKYFKKATQRNRARRLVSSAFESLYNSLLKNINIVALPKAGVLDVKSGDLSLDLESVLRENKIIV